MALAFTLVWLGSLAMPLAPVAAAAGPDDPPLDFGRDVQPILSDLCYDCHGPDAAARKADLRLDVRDDLLFVAEPGAPDESELLRRLSHPDPKRRMPPEDYERRPTDAQIALLRRWVQEGLAWEQHWAFQPVASTPPPPDSADSWCRDPLDGFVLEHLRANGLAPSPEADRATWLRRVTFDLTGLPPTVEALAAFLADPDADDPSAGAEARVVDRLLASPARAEHRTREWLDLARYADTNGYQNDFGRDPWPWRDWVLRAFAANLPYDEFVAQQVAGDLLPDATPEQVLATGFNRNHRTVTEAGSLDEEWRVENVADRAETTATAFLGLTLGCARCHDHKYDALTQRDYYAFYGFFDQVDEQGVYQEARGNVPPLIRVPSSEQVARLAQLDAAIGDAERVVEGLADGAPERYARWRAARAASPSEAPRDPLLTFGAQGVQLTGDAAQSIDLGHAVAFEEDRPFSVSLWVRPEGHGAVYSRMADDDTYRGTDLVLLEDMRPAVHVIHQWTPKAIKVVGREALVRGPWHHIAVTYDGSRKAAGVTLWVDGERAPLTVEVDSLAGTIATEEPLRIGQRRYAGALAGDVLDFRVDARALERDEVRALAEARVRADGEDARGLAGFQAVFDDTSSAARATLADLRRERSELDAAVPTAMVLKDRAEPRETRVLARGRYDKPSGEHLAPDIPAVFGGLPQGAPRSRAGLAQWLVDAGNPLTARVAVNRIWAGFFGAGLVATPEDFGVRGDRPAQRALLDHLAASFVASGWDVAALERRIALSATYRQSSRATDALRERDPANRLLARGPRHRLAAEAVRDQALVASGLLRARFGGPPVKPYQPPGLWLELAGGAGQGAYVPSTGDDLFRRSVYTYRKRTVPHPTLTTFDAPGFETCAARRARTNTPLQALALLNDVTYVEAARHLAARMLAASGEDDARLAFGVRALLTREVTARELEVLRAGLVQHRASFAADPEAAKAHLAVGATGVVIAPESTSQASAQIIDWAAYSLVAETLMNLDEAVTKR